MSVFLDLTEVKANEFKPQQLPPPGQYLVRCISVEKKKTASGTGEFLSCKFKFVTEEFDKISFYHQFNIKNESAKAQEIGLQQLKSFLESAGHGVVLENMADLIGLTAFAQVGKEIYKDKENIRIKYFVTQKTEQSSTPTGEALFS